MLNNFCFYVHAQKSLFMGENGNAFFGPHPHHPKNKEHFRVTVLKVDKRKCFYFGFLHFFIR